MEDTCDMNEKNRFPPLYLHCHQSGRHDLGNQNKYGKTKSVFKIKHILIIQTKCTMFIPCIYLLNFSYMLRYYIHHHKEELLWPLLKTIFCYVAFNCGFYSSYVVNYKRCNSV